MDKALYAVVMEAYTGGISTRKVDALVGALGGDSGISKSEVSRICQGLDEQVKAFLGRPLEHVHFPYVYLDATYLHGRLGRNLQVVSRAVVVAIGINALGYREVLGIAVGDSEAEAFWRQFLGSLKERGLTGTRLVISDAHLGLTAAIKRMFQGSSWQRVTAMLAKQFPKAVPGMVAARDDVLAFLHFPQEHWRKIWSTNPLERLNVGPRGALGSAVIKRRTNVVGIFPNDAAIVRLVGIQLLEQQEEWQLERRRFFSEATMAKPPQPEELLGLTDGDPAEQAAVAVS